MTRGASLDDNGEIDTRARGGAARPRFPLESVLLAAVLIAAGATRAWGLFAGIPYAVGIDEPAIIERALRILRTGDWNPHFFDYPSLVIYLHTAVAAARFVWGAVEGKWASLGAMDAAAFYAWSRVAAAGIGVATVWVTYRLGRRLESPWLGLAAAAQLAVLPLHVRESHYALTDVPATCLVMVTLLLAARASGEHTIRSYALAGAAAGLAAAAKYNAAVVILPVLLVWLLWERGAAQRGRTLAALAGAAGAAFLAGAPYTVLDLPGFLNGFGAQLARFAPGARTLAEPAGVLYLKHLNLAGATWLPVAAIGLLVVLLRVHRWRTWAPVVGFLVAYAYVLASHPLVFARYALPVVPVVCLFAGVAMTRLAAAARRLTGSRPAGQVVMLGGVLLVIVPFTIGSLGWLRQVQGMDTRTVAAEGMRAVLPPGVTVAVENYDPTNLEHAGFKVVQTQRLFDHDRDWYVTRKVAYFVVSAEDLRPYEALLRAAPLVRVFPAPGQWGPPISVFPVQVD